MKKIFVAGVALLLFLFGTDTASAKCKASDVQKKGQAYVNQIYAYSSFGADKPVLQVSNAKQPKVNGSKVMAYSNGSVIILWAKAYKSKSCSRVQQSIIHEYIHHLDYKYNFSKGQNHEKFVNNNLDNFKNLIWKNKVNGSFIQELMKLK